MRTTRLISLQLSEQNDGNWTVYANVQDSHDDSLEPLGYGTSLPFAIERAIQYLKIFEGLAPTSLRTRNET